MLPNRMQLTKTVEDQLKRLKSNTDITPNVSARIAFFRSVESGFTFTKADEKKLLGEAEAAIIREMGEAEARVLERKAEAYKQYGEAAVVQMIVEKLPEIAGKVADPLKATEKMVFVSSDGSAGSQLTGDITRILGQLPDVVEGLTGFDMRKAVSNAVKENKVKSASEKDLKLV